MREERHLYLVHVRATAFGSGRGTQSIYVHNAEQFGCEDGPVTDINGRILFFDRVTDASAILQLGACKFHELSWAAPSDALDLDTDWVLKNGIFQSQDHQSKLLNSLHLIRDFARATSYSVPEDHEEVLRELCMWLTTHDSIANFFDESMWSREMSRDALVWLCGAIFCSARFVPADEIPST